MEVEDSDNEIGEAMDEIDEVEEPYGSTDGEEVESFPDGEDELLDTTAGQLAAGKDIQGINWDQLPFSRYHYREQRLKQYVNFMNCKEEVEGNKEKLEKSYKDVSKGARLYDFCRNYRSVRSTIVHFQLRNLLWPTSKHDVYVMNESCINHWSTVSRKSTKVLDLAGGPDGGRAPGLGPVQISTMCVWENLVAAGGFTGELVVKNTDQNRVVASLRVTLSENGITNGIEIARHPSGGPRIMTSNNDSMVRVFDANTMELVSRFTFPWAVNYASVCPDGGRIVCVAGDAPEVCLCDSESGKLVAALKGHLDYSFAAAWHPDGHLLATGNQDTTTRLWDVRYLGDALAVLPGRIAAIRSLRFSPCGRFLAVAEPADFVHVYDVRANFARSQEVDFFGEIAGIGFSPDSSAFFVSIADVTYSSLLHFTSYSDSRPYLLANPSC